MSSFSSRFTQTKKLNPAGGPRWKVKGSSKPLGFILWGAWTSEPNLMWIYPSTVAEISQYRRGPTIRIEPRCYRRWRELWIWQKLFTLCWGRKEWMLLFFTPLLNTQWPSHSRSQFTLSEVEWLFNSMSATRRLSMKTCQSAWMTLVHINCWFT